MKARQIAELVYGEFSPLTNLTSFDEAIDHIEKLITESNIEYAKSLKTTNDEEVNHTHEESITCNGGNCCADCINDNNGKG